MRTSDIFSKESRQDMDSEALDALGDNLKSKFLELRKNIEGVAEAYEAKAQQLFDKARAMRGWINTLGNDDSLPPKNEEALVDHTRIAEDKADIAGIVQSFVKNFDRNKTFTCHNIMRTIKSQVQIRNKKNIIRRIAGILGHLVQNGDIISIKKADCNIYSFPEKASRLKEVTLSHNILRAIDTLEKSGSKITAKAIRSFLVSDGLFTYENLKLRDVSSSIYFLKGIKKHIRVKSKTGKETTYELTEEGKAALENLKKGNAHEKKVRRSSGT